MSLKTIKRARKVAPEQSLLLLAKLLRQIMMHRQPGLGSVSGERWLQNLDAEFSTQWFSTEQGRVFGDALYEPCERSSEQRDHWCNTLETLIRKLPCPPRTGKPTSSATRQTSA
jgi:hypothetical protein